MNAFILLVAAGFLISSNCISQPFWLTTKLENIQWKHGCVALISCNKPIFVISQYNIINHQRISKIWEISKGFDKVFLNFVGSLTLIS